jgi:glucuronokinase
VGLVGNPSDGHGGAVIAAPVRSLTAVVEARASATRRFVTGGERRVIDAALDRLAAHLGCDGGIEVRWRTNVPVAVGLAGSSALVIATIDAAAAVWGAQLDRRVVAALALAAEVEGLGIAAGWQDRIVQAHDQPVLVDASTMEVVDGLAVPVVRPLHSDAPIEVLVGWDPSLSSHSGDYHATPVRAAGASSAMAELGALARAAVATFESGDVAGFAVAVDRTWCVRQSVRPLREDHAALIERVRAAGLMATTPGSGGAVVVVPRDARERTAATVLFDATGVSWLPQSCR